MPSIPALGKDDKYHVFISYSNGDSIWVAGLIHKLEAAFPDLKICFHERDFVPGKTIIDNLLECIESSQKTVMVLSPDFVRSRWCLYEAKLSIFQDCIMQKAIIPIMLKPCSFPLHLSHLTYLEADDEEFFDKLTQALLSKNSQLVHSTLIHYQPSFLYNGKSLLTLPALNENGKSWQPGVFLSRSVPDSLRAVINDARVYEQAMETINGIPSPKSLLRFTVCQISICILIAAFIIYLSVFIVFSISIGSFPNERVYFNMLTLLPIVMVVVLLMPTLCIKILCWKCNQAKLVTREMVKKTGQANLILSRTSVLTGCSSRTQLCFVYVSLSQCMETFYTTFGHGSTLATDMWEKAIITYSSNYACCLAKKHFPFNSTESFGHVQDGICFCQYVYNELRMKNCNFQLL